MVRQHNVYPNIILKYFLYEIKYLNNKILTNWKNNKYFFDENILKKMLTSYLAGIRIKKGIKTIHKLDVFLSI
jgi:hypothetical protein